MVVSLNFENLDRYPEGSTGWSIRIFLFSVQSFVIFVYTKITENLDSEQGAVEGAPDGTNQGQGYAKKTGGVWAGECF